MKTSIAILLCSVLIISTASGQTPQKKQQEDRYDDVVRITTNLVQTDLVVTDKNDQIIKDLTLADFELYDNGKKQEIKFMEFVGVDTDKRVEGAPPPLPSGVAELPSSGLSAANLKRVIAFVVDDLTIPSEDLARVRDLMSNFVDNQMVAGDLVSIVRVIGGNGLLQQFTSDKQLLRQAIRNLTPKAHPFVQGAEGFVAADRPPNAADTTMTNTDAISSSLDAETQTEDVNKGFRSLMSLSTTNSVITSLRSIPGRKSVVLISGGLPLYQANEQGMAIDRGTGEMLSVDAIRPLYVDIASIINTITDNAARSGVVLNTLDVRGLQPATTKFADTPGKSALGMTAGGQTIGGGGEDPTFGRGANMALITASDAIAGAQGLRNVANATGGISAVNTNNFAAGLDKILARSLGYYTIGYSPSEKFDAKFHKISVKVKRDNAHVYARAGYIAREEQTDSSAQVTKENKILRAATSPLTKTELGVATLVQHVFLPDGKAKVDIDLSIDAKTLQFTQSADGTYQDSFDVVGFVFDHTGKLRGGFSNTINPKLTPEQYKQTLASGLSDAAHTELPPGYFDLRVVVRENETGRLGTSSRYLEVPNISRKLLTMSSLFLFSVPPNQSGNTGIVPLQALREISRKQDLRYAAVVYNPKVSSGQHQVQTQTIISQGSKVLLREPPEPLKGPLSGVQIVKIGQVGLAKVPPGHYVLTLITTDPLADKKVLRTVSRSIDFTVVN